MNETWIKAYRALTKWRWYKDSYTFHIFMHLLLNATIKDVGVYDITLKRGEYAASYLTLANDTGMSIQNVRTAVKHLKLTGELTVTKYPKFSVFTVVNYTRYQGGLTSDLTADQQATNTQLTVDQQATNTQNKNIKNIKNINNIREREDARPTLEEVKAYFNEKTLNGDAEAFYDNYQGVGWVKANGTPISDWKAVARNWSRKEKNFQSKPKKESVYSSDASYDLEAYRKSAIGLREEVNNA